jgi:hypothetical protein
MEIERIEEDEKNRRHKLMLQCQEYMAAAAIADKNNPASITAQIGQLAGRTVKCVASPDSAIRLYQTLILAPEEDQIRDGYVNSTKKHK